MEQKKKEKTSLCLFVRLKVFFFWWARETLTTSSAVKWGQLEPLLPRQVNVMMTSLAYRPVLCVAYGSREDMVAVLFSMGYHPILHRRAS